MELIIYKFRANIVPLHELSQVILIFIQRHEEPPTKRKHFSLFSRPVSTFLLAPTTPCPALGRRGLTRTMKSGGRRSSRFEDAD
jgi:hypothetical protein